MLLREHKVFGKRRIGFRELSFTLYERLEERSDLGSVVKDNTNKTLI
jgi:hypothetical protein